MNARISLCELIFWFREFTQNFSLFVSSTNNNYSHSTDKKNPYHLDISIVADGKLGEPPEVLLPAATKSPARTVSDQVYGVQT